jgi:tetrapyrrole methylase family protein/MazG family protein
MPIMPVFTGKEALMMSRDYLNEFHRFKTIIDRLRGPDGCPWDKQQTHRSLKPYLIEETYEVAGALDGEKPEKLCEELGDLLLQIMLHARIGEEEKLFSIDDVIRSISDKMVRRHPHIFGDTTANTAAEVSHNWELLKREGREDESVLAGVPLDMPALSYSQIIQRKAAAAGFDWKQTEDILDKVTEEAGELIEAKTDKEREAEYGDLLFVLVNLARWLDIDAEEALRNANRRFFHRFTCMEGICRSRGLSFRELSFSEQNDLWDEAKKKVG